MGVTRFADKIGFIVGGSSGIGLATAKVLAEEGAHVIIFGRNKDRLDTAVEEVKASCSAEQRIASMQLDATDPEETGRVLGQAVEEFGTPDLLLNCAGRAQPNYVENISYEQFDQTMKSNMYSVRNTVAALLPHMKAHGGGHIANVSSMIATIPFFGFTDYCASKAAIIAFSEALHAEAKPYGISVSVLLPPDTDTPGLERENRNKPPETKALSEMSKLIQPEFVARKLVQGIKKGKIMIIPTFEERFFYLVKRLLPGLVTRVLDSIIRKTQKKEG
jgi:short-subunit dehydrogenase